MIKRFISFLTSFSMTLMLFTGMPIIKVNAASYDTGTVNFRSLRQGDFIKPGTALYNDAGQDFGISFFTSNNPNQPVTSVILQSGKSYTFEEEYSKEGIAVAAPEMGWKATNVVDMILPNWGRTVCMSVEGELKSAEEETNAEKIAEAKKEAESELSRVTAENFFEAQNIQRVIENRLNLANIKNITVTIENFSKTEATSSTEGNISGTIRLTYDGVEDSLFFSLPINKLEHTHSFVSHGAVSATCTTTGNDAYWTCSGCNKMFSDENGTTEINEIPTIPAAGHTFSTDWTYDETHHWHAATCVHTEEIDGKAAHIFFEGKCTVCPKTDPNYNQPTDTEPTVTEPPVTEPSGTEPVATNPPYIPYFPSNNTSAVSVSKEPFLQNENGKIGWDVISDDIWETPDGETVIVNMNGTTELPKNIVSDIAGRDIDLVLIMNGGFIWTINGMSVTKAKTVDMSVRKISKIPKSVVQEYFGDVKTVQLDLRHNGDFGFIAELTIDLGSRYSGMYANSYCYKSRKFEFGDSSEIVDGQAKLRFTHASSWLITVESSPVLEDVSSGAAAHSSGTPIDMSNSANGGITLPEFDEDRKLKLSNRKRRYRILRKRRLDDLVFVF